MKIRGRSGLFISACLLALLPAAAPSLRAAGGRGAAPEYSIKAAYLYNFLQFVTWPPAGDSDKADLVIGVIGRDPFGSAFDEVKNKKVRGLERKLVVREFGASAPPEELKQCDILFVPASERERYADILGGLEKYPVLTVGESDGFLESGGMINLLVVGNNIRWEINKESVDRAGLRAASQLLGNALRVIKAAGAYR